MTPGMMDSSRVSTGTSSGCSTGLAYRPTVSLAVAGRMDTEHWVCQLQLIARRLLFSVANLSSGERDLLEDVQRGRYPMVATRRLLEIGSRSAKPEDREAFAELARGLSLTAVPAVVDWKLAGDLETRAQAAHDVAWREFEWAPSRITCDRAIETGTAQWYGTRAELDALHAFRR